MAFPPRLLHAGEETVVDVRPHWTSFAGPALVLVGALAVLNALSAAGAHDLLQLLAAAATLVALARFVVRYVRWATTSFVVTDQRLVQREGVLAKETVEIPLDRVDAVRLRRSVLGRLLGYGDLMVESGGERGERRHPVARLPDPVAVQREISRQLTGHRRRP